MSASSQINLQRINQVIDYVERNLENDLSLKILAEVACFSPFHFHRIFATITGETLHEFVNRKRLEKIATAILRNKHQPIKEICLKYGFDNAVSFARSFKKFYGISATEMRKQASASFNQLVWQNSKIGKEKIAVSTYIYRIDELRAWMTKRGEVSVEWLPAQKVAYVRNQGSFDQVLEAFLQLRDQADELGLLNRPPRTWLMVIHDNPAITEEVKMIQSACLALADDVSTSGKIPEMIIPAGRYLCGKFTLAEDEFKQAWDGMSIWLMDEMLEPGDGFYFERFHTDSLFLPQQKHQVDICIPLK